MKTDSFGYLAIRPVSNIHGFKTNLQQLNDEQEVTLYTFSSATKPRKSNVHFVTMYIDEAASLVAREQNKLADIKQRIMDLEMLVDLEGRIQQEVTAVRSVYGQFKGTPTETAGPPAGFAAISLLGAYLNAEYAHRQLDAHLNRVDMLNDVTAREAAGLRTLDYINSLKEQADQYNQMTATAKSMNQTFSNAKGKLQYKHLYSKGEAIWNMNLDNLLKEKNWEALQTRMAKNKQFLQAMENIAKGDDKKAKAVDRLVRRSNDLQEAEELILAAGITD